MKEIVVTIPEEVSREVELLFYKYNSLMNIIVFLEENNKIDEERLEKKIDDLTLIYAELEKKKEYYSSIYQSEIKGTPISYTFNFIEKQIIYEVEDE